MITKETKKVENKYEALKVLQKENIKLASDNLNYFRENYLKEAPLNQDFYKVSEENNSNLSLSEKYELASNLSKKNLELAKSNYDLFNSKIKKETGTKKDLESEVETRYSPKQEDLESEDKSNLENDLESEVKDKKNKKGFFRNIGNAVNDVFEAYINSFGPLGTDMLDREYPGIRKVETRYSPKQEDLESEDKLNLENDLESEVQLSPEETFEGSKKHKIERTPDMISNYGFLENEPVAEGEELVLYKSLDGSDLEFEVKDKKNKKGFFRNIGNAVNDVFESYINSFGSLGTDMLDKEYPGIRKVEIAYSPKKENLESEIKSNLENQVQLSLEETFEGSKKHKIERTPDMISNYGFLENEPVAEGEELVLYKSLDGSDLEFEVKDKKNKKGFFRNIGNAVNDVFESYINSFGSLGTDMLDKEYPGIRKIETRYSPKQEDLESEDKLNLENDLESEVQLSPEETFEGLNKLKLKIDSNIIPNYNFLENKPVSKGEELVLYKLTDKSDLEFEVQVNSSYFSEEVSTGESSPETEVDYSPKEENLKSEVKETQKKKTEFFRNIGNAVNDVFEAYTNYFFNREKFLKFIQGQKGIYESTMGIESPVFLFKPTEKIFLPASSVDKTRKPFTKSKFNRKY